SWGVLDHRKHGMSDLGQGLTADRFSISRPQPGLQKRLTPLQALRHFPTFAAIAQVPSDVVCLRERKVVLHKQCECFFRTIAVHDRPPIICSIAFLRRRRARLTCDRTVLSEDSRIAATSVVDKPSMSRKMIATRSLSGKPSKAFRNIRRSSCSTISACGLQ